MKKIGFLFMMVAIAAVSFLTSCGGGVTDTVDIASITNDIDANVADDADTLVFDLNAAKAGKDVKFTLTINADSVNSVAIASVKVTEPTLKIDTIFTETSTASTLTKVVSVNIPQPANETVVKYTFTFLATDNAKTPTTHTKTVDVYAKLIPLKDKVVEFKAVKLQYNNGSSTSYASSTPFYQLTKTAVKAVGPTAAVADIDAVLFFQTSYGVALCSPDAKLAEDVLNANTNLYVAAGKNTTKLMKSTLNYATATPAEVKALVVTSSNVGATATLGVGIANIAVGDVIAFETKTGVKGLLKITANAKATATLTSDVKVFVPASAGK